LEAITAANFESLVLQSDKPVLLDFWGPQCAPCLALKPSVEALAAAYAGRANVYAVDATQNRRLCIQLRVMGLPSFLIFKGGVETARVSGTVTPQDLEALLI
jgi:thioredoxin 1